MAEKLISLNNLETYNEQIKSTYATKTEISNKVDKVLGKGLSTNDYTTDEKNKLAGLAAITVDSALSGDSTNPVQNKVVKAALDGKVSKSGDTMTGNLTFTTTKGIKYAAQENDTQLWQVYDTNGSYGYTLQYNGSGSGNNNDLVLISDNQSGTKINAVTVKQDGTMTFAKAITASGGITGNLIGNATSATTASSVAWSNISGKPNTFDPASHNQASNTIIAMTGYSKPNSAGAISINDTLNDAIGKLEKGLEGKQASGNYATKNELAKVQNEIPLNLSELTNNVGYVTQTWVEGKGYQTSAQVKATKVDNATTADSATYATTAGSATKATQDGNGKNIANTYATKTSLNNYVTYNGLSESFDSKLAAVAQTGSYNDLLNKPTSMPASDVSDWAKESSKPTYTWNEIINKPDTFPPESHTHNYLPLSGGTITGSITPETSNNGQIGSSSNKFNSMYALKFYGDVQGDVTGNIQGQYYDGEDYCDIIHSGNIGKQSVNHATTATKDGKGNIIENTYLKTNGANAANDVTFQNIESFTVTTTDNGPIDFQTNGTFTYNKKEVATKDDIPSLAQSFTGGNANPILSTTTVPTTQALSDWFGNIGPGSTLRKWNSTDNNYELNKSKVLFSNSSGYITGSGTIGSGAFYSASSYDVPKFGTLPIAQGGTGATTAAAARTNLGITPANIGAAEKSQLQLLENALDGLDDRVSALESSICFQEGTQILMADGMSKNIEDILPGDMIMSWDNDTNSLIPCKTFGILWTGRANKWNYFCFDNGSVLKIFHSHRIYNDDKKSLTLSSGWKVGDHGISSEGKQVTYCYSPSDKNRAIISKNKYTLMSETGMFFADGILCGHPLGEALDLYYRTNGKRIKMTTEEVELFKEYIAANEAEYQVELQHPEYIQEALPVWRTLQEADKKIVSCKDKLAKRDYKTIKAMQGKLSEEEINENIRVCDGLRDEINAKEVVVDECNKQLNALRNKHNIVVKTFGEVESINVKKAIAKARAKYKN